MEFTVPAVLDLRASQYGDRVMMSVAGEAVSFEQMRQRTGVAAAALQALGIGRGDCVALFTGTCPEWIYFWLGAARIGAISAAVNAASRGEFLAHALSSAWAKLVITDAEHLPRVHEIRDVLSVETVTCDAALARGAGRTPRDDPAATGEPGAIFFTSGTTGASKAVVTSWHYLFSAAATVAAAWEFQAGETVWTAMPLFHLSAVASVLAPMLVGGTTVLAEAFHPGTAWAEMRACGAVGFAGAGAMVAMLAGLPASPADREVGLRFISAAPIAAGDYRAIEDRYRCRVVTMYGMTEAFPITVKAVSDSGVPGTSGTPTDHFEVRIDDGEIVCRARYPHVMSEGYLGTDGDVVAHPEWFRTGDLGAVDAAGNLTYVDRLKDSLRRRGENVSSIEVETAVLAHPGVAEAAVVGVPSELGEDDILLFVTAVDVLDYVELLDFCAQRMPYFCVPRYVEIVDEIPRTIIGRVRKDVLRARGIGPQTWDREHHGYRLRRDGRKTG